MVIQVAISSGPSPEAGSRPTTAPVQPLVEMTLRMHLRHEIEFAAALLLDR